MRLFCGLVITRSRLNKPASSISVRFFCRCARKFVFMI